MDLSRSDSPTPTTPRSAHPPCGTDDLVDESGDSPSRVETSLRRFFSRFRPLRSPPGNSSQAEAENSRSLQHPVAEGSLHDAAERLLLQGISRSNSLDFDPRLFPARNNSVKVSPP